MKNERSQLIRGAFEERGSNGRILTCHNAQISVNIVDFALKGTNESAMRETCCIKRKMDRNINMAIKNWKRTIKGENNHGRPLIYR